MIVGMVCDVGRGRNGSPSAACLRFTHTEHIRFLLSLFPVGHKEASGQHLSGMSFGDVRYVMGCGIWDV